MRHTCFAPVFLAGSIVSALSLLAPASLAQPGWNVLSPATSPGARWATSITWHPGLQGAVMHGGSTSTIFDDTWLWTGTTWQQLATGFSRTEHAVVYDSARHELLLFGGRDATGCRDGLWVFTGTSWQQKSASNKPPARCGHGMAYDSRRQRVVVFGGRNDARAILGDIWEWDGQTWQEVTPTSGPAPSARVYSGMAYDDAHGYVVVHGGREQSGSPISVGDTWTWDGTAWQDVTGSTPPPPPLVRSLHRLAYDPVLRRVVMFGGSSPSTVHLDTLEWDGAAWRLACANCMSTGLDDPAATYDPVRQCVLAFGGSNLASQVNEVREFAHFATASSIGMGCQGTNGVPLLSACPSSLPILGQRACVHLANAPISPAPVLFIGNPLGFAFELRGLGAPGCWLYTNPWLEVRMVSVATGWEWTFPKTTPIGWIDQSLRLQAIMLDPSNALGVTTSNAIDFVFGVRE